MNELFVFMSVIFMSVFSFAAALPTSNPVIGPADYRRMLYSGHIVDKTMLIKSIVDDKTEVVLITRPRRWGKTTALSMLEYFFAKQIRYPERTQRII